MSLLNNSRSAPTIRKPEFIEIKLRRVDKYWLCWKLILLRTSLIFGRIVIIFLRNKVLNPIILSVLLYLIILVSRYFRTDPIFRHIEIILGVRYFLLLSVICLWLLAIVREGFLGPLHVIEMGETLVVYSKFKLFTVLYNVQHVSSNLERVLEGSAELLQLKYNAAVMVNLLFTAEMAADKLYCCEGWVETQLPNELWLWLLYTGTYVVTFKIYCFYGHFYTFKFTWIKCKFRPQRG